MESTDRSICSGRMEYSSKTKRTKLSPTAAHGGGGGGCDDDLISGLCDDVLLRILDLVTDARDVVRTGALSRRWRGLWTRVPALRFTPWSSPWPWFTPDHSTQRFITFVSDVLARRAQSRDAIEHLTISFTVAFIAVGEVQLGLPSIRAAEEWIRYAVQQPVKSFNFEMRLPRPLVVGDESQERPIMALDKLPSYAKLETMRLELDGLRVRLPSTLVFASLVDLTLRFLTDCGHHLARFLSSARCPRLSKLSMCLVHLPAGSNELLLESGSLSELWLDEMSDMFWLELRTPSLRVLRIEECYELEALKVSAPRLEELTFMDNPMQVDIDGDLSSVGRLKLDLCSYRHTDDHESNISLLQRCSSARRLDVSLSVALKDSHNVDIIKGRITHLDHVTSLKLYICPLRTTHSAGDRAASLLTIFNNLMNLCLDFDSSVKPADALSSGSDKDSNFICDHLDHWKSHKLPFAHLQEAELRGLTGTNCELRFLQFVLASATQLQKVVVSFNPHYLVEDKRDDFQHMLLDGGTWIACHDAYQSYEWRPCQ